MMDMQDSTMDQMVIWESWAEKTALGLPLKEMKNLMY